MPKSIYYDENGNEQILSSSPSALSGLLDADITTPQANQVLAYDGDNWVNSDLYSTTTVGNIVFRKYGNVVTVFIATGSYTTNASGRIVIDGNTILIPSGYRPQNEFNTYETNDATRITFTASGEIILPNKISTSLYVRVGATWVI